MGTTIAFTITIAAFGFIAVVLGYALLAAINEKPRDPSEPW